MIIRFLSLLVLMPLIIVVSVGQEMANDEADGILEVLQSPELDAFLDSTFHKYEDVDAMKVYHNYYVRLPQVFFGKNILHMSDSLIQQWGDVMRHKQNNLIIGVESSYKEDQCAIIVAASYPYHGHIIVEAYLTRNYQGYNYSRVVDSVRHRILFSLNDEGKYRMTYYTKGKKSNPIMLD